MKKILFPSDFSETATTAFLYALHFADKMEAEVVVLHVYDLPIVDTPPLPDSTQEIFDIVEMNEFESFREQLPELHELADRENFGHVPLRSILLYGDLLFNINKVCKEEDISMIVMGSKGASGLKETFLGSTTASVIANAHVPVLGVPAEARHHNIRNIAFTTQYKDKDSEALRNTIAVAELFNSRIQCLYIKTNDSDNPQNRIDEWKEYFSANNIEFFTIEGESVEQALLDFVEEHQSDMLVMRTHKRGFFEGLFHRSLTKKMAYHTRVPLLVYPDQQA